MQVCVGRSVSIGRYPCTCAVQSQSPLRPTSRLASRQQRGRTSRGLHLGTQQRAQVQSPLLAEVVHGSRPSERIASLQKRRLDRAAESAQGTVDTVVVSEVKMSSPERLTHVTRGHCAFASTMTSRLRCRKWYLAGWQWGDVGFNHTSEPSPRDYLLLDAERHQISRYSGAYREEMATPATEMTYNIRMAVSIHTLYL